MSIIAEFSETTGIMKIGAGYQDVSSYRLSDLQEMLAKFNPDTKDVRIAFIPHNEGGNALLLKTRDADHWICISPTIYQSAGRVQTFLNSLFGW